MDEQTETGIWFWITHHRTLALAALVAGIVSIVSMIGTIIQTKFVIEDHRVNEQPLNDHNQSSPKPDLPTAPPPVTPPDPHVTSPSGQPSHGNAADQPSSKSDFPPPNSPVIAADKPAPPSSDQTKKDTEGCATDNPPINCLWK